MSRSKADWKRQNDGLFKKVVCTVPLPGDWRPLVDRHRSLVRPRCGSIAITVMVMVAKSAGHDTGPESCRSSTRLAASANSVAAFPVTEISCLSAPRLALFPSGMSDAGNNDTGVLALNTIA